MSIPDEAVKAAAMAIFGVDEATWELQMPQTKDKYLWEGRAALEAAAPYLNIAPTLCSTCEGTGLADPEEKDLETVCPMCKGSGLE